MQTLMPETRLTVTRGAAAAYGNVARDTVNARDAEHLAFERATHAMLAAEAPDVHFTTRIKAIHDNRTLWQTLACDLASEENGLPVDLRARLISLAIWVTGESDRAMTGASLQPMIDINHMIMRGLRPASEGTI